MPNNSVAIIMPYYNEPQLLLKSVVGIMGQSYTNWTLIIVDDGSDPDKAANKVLPEYAIPYERIIIRSQPNRKVASARNHGLAYANAWDKYDYIAYCDADDIWDTNHLKSSIHFIEDKKVDMVYSNVRFRFPNNDIAIPYGIPQYEEYPGIEALLKQNFIYISGVVHNIEVYRQTGDFDGELNSLEDWDYWLRVAKAGYKISKNKHSYITYTCKPDGNGSKRTDDIYNKILTKHDITNNTNS